MIGFLENVITYTWLGGTTNNYDNRLTESPAHITHIADYTRNLLCQEFWFENDLGVEWFLLSAAMLVKIKVYLWQRYKMLQKMQKGCDYITWVEEMPGENWADMSGCVAGSLSLIHHTAGELFNAWQAPWSLVNRINKISISQKMKASCHKLCQQQQPWIWASLSLSWSPCFTSVLLRDQIPRYLTHSENNFNFCEGHSSVFSSSDFILRLKLL